MGVKWTPDNDQLLLLKILETHDVHLDTKKISAAWPTDKGEIPTARAITERLVKIRKDAKSAGSGHFGISSSQSKGVGTARKDATKSSTPRSATPKTATPRKLKRTPINDEDGGEESPSKRGRTGSIQVKTEQSVETDDCLVSTAAPTLRPQVQAPAQQRAQPVFRTPSAAPCVAPAQTPVRQHQLQSSQRVPYRDPAATPMFPQPQSNNIPATPSPSRNTWLDGATDPSPRPAPHTTGNHVATPMRNPSVAPASIASFGGSASGSAATTRSSVPLQARPNIPPQHIRPSMTPAPQPQPKPNIKQESWLGKVGTGAGAGAGADAAAQARSYGSGYDSGSDYEEDAV